MNRNDKTCLNCKHAHYVRKQFEQFADKRIYCDRQLQRGPYVPEECGEECEKWEGEDDE